eukprot:793733_1
MSASIEDEMVFRPDITVELTSSISRKDGSMLRGSMVASSARRLTGRDSDAIIKNRPTLRKLRQMTSNRSKDINALTNLESCDVMGVEDNYNESIRQENGSHEIIT